MKSRHMDLFLIPTVLLTSVTLLVNPVLFLCILCFPSLRQETRYLLLANVLVADVLFLGINLTVASCNTGGKDMPHILCEFMLLSTVTTYSCSVLTVTLMVVDTYVAVRWPLRYNEILPPCRAKKIIVGLWVLSAVCPVSLLVMFEVFDSEQQSRPVCLVLIALHSLSQKMTTSVHLYFIVAVSLCTVLIVYCYIRLYVITKTSGIWRNRYSRARMTLLAHALLLMMYFTPALVFAVELALLQDKKTVSEVAVWINLVNMSVLMLLPRFCTPYLYILRYREIYETLQQVLLKKRHVSQITAA